MKKIWGTLKDYVVAFVIALILSNIVGCTHVVGESMQPTLNNHDILLVNKIKSNDPKQGDIIIFKTHFKNNIGTNKRFVKRIIGIEGDKNTIKNGNVYINNSLLSEPYINNKYTHGNIDIVVPDNKVFVMGDNRDNSLDSRKSEVGCVDVSDIEAVMSLKLYPLNKLDWVD